MPMSLQEGVRQVHVLQANSTRVAVVLNDKTELAVTALHSPSRSQRRGESRDAGEEKLDIF